MWWKATLWLYAAVALASTAGFIIDRNLQHDQAVIHNQVVTIPSVTYNPVQPEMEISEATDPSIIVKDDDKDDLIIENEGKPGDESKIGLDTDVLGNRDDDSKSEIVIGDDSNPDISMPQVTDPIKPRPDGESSDSNGSNRIAEGGNNDNYPSEPVGVNPPDTHEDPNPNITPPIETTYGPVQGFYTDDTRRMRGFYDIPYGSVGLRLFLPPTEPNKREVALQNEGHTVRCLQMEDTQVGELECLTLSVFAPETANNAKVLFHIHNGNFDSGSGDPNTYGPEHLVDKDVIVVLPNYRLGLLGFLCLQNEIAPGNAGLKDLTLALQWTKSNIENFGGNSSDIVVSGFGAAGALASYLAISPKSKDFVSKVIVESGSAFAHWAIDRNPLHTAQVIHQKIGNKTIFTEAEIQSYMSDARDMKFKPCIETGNTTDTFLSKSPWEILQDNATEIHSKFMIGSANLAGTHEALSHTAESLTQLNASFSKFLPNDLRFPNENKMLEIANRVKEHYFGERSVNDDSRMELARCYTDASYLAPLLQTARALLERGAIVYLYEFSFLGDLNRERKALKSSLEGAARGDVIGYVFTQDKHIPDDDTDEKRALETVVQLWTSFIENGKPEIEGTEWPELKIVNDTEEQYLSIGSRLAESTGLHLEEMRLWTQIYADHFVETNFALGLHIQSSTIFLVFTFSVLVKNLI